MPFEQVGVSTIYSIKNTCVNKSLNTPNSEQRFSPEAILFLQNVIEVAFAAGVEPALNAMIADRSRGNEDIRGDGFAALGVIMHLSDARFCFFLAWCGCGCSWWCFCSLLGQKGGTWTKRGLGVFIFFFLNLLFFPSGVCQ